MGLKDKVKARIEGWNGQLFLKVGKATLIKDVPQAISTYTMTTFKISKSLCSDMDAVVRNF